MAVKKHSHPKWSNFWGSRQGNNDLELHLDRRNKGLTSDLILDGVQLEMKFD